MDKINDTTVRFARTEDIDAELLADALPVRVQLELVSPKALKGGETTELEFEDAGEAEIFFLPVKPGKYRFYAKGLEGKGMLGHFVVK